MLSDKATDCESLARSRRNAARLRTAVAQFIQNLAPWIWFVTITFRDYEQTLQQLRRSSRPVVVGQSDYRALCAPDPRIENHLPWSRYRRLNLTTSPRRALALVEEWLEGLRMKADEPVGWVLVEEFGRVAGRWHCHVLISGVSRLDPRPWCRSANRRFGRTAVDSFDPLRDAGPYVAKYLNIGCDSIHFGGTLRGRRLFDSAQSPRPIDSQGIEVVTSPNLGQSFYKLSLQRRHR
jgi:hypothetical protein